MKDAIRTALDVASACGVATPVLVPGNIGASAAAKLFSPADEQIIEAGNLWGFVLDEVARRCFPAVILVGHPGKLAKLIRGDWDTHSSRSERAVDLVAEIASGILSLSFAPTETVEGIFAALSPADRQRLGDELASRIGEAVLKRIGVGPAVAVVLVDMAGNQLGSSGDLAPWR
jgi:cobalt-precorrin-5B (C1)-methyltransferase